MDIKKIVIPAIGIGTVVTNVLLLKGNLKTASNVSSVATEAIKETEETFGGVPLSKFTELAKQCYHGIKCTIDQWGFLVFHSTSNSGRTKFHTQMTIDGAGKLVNLGGHYPGQWWSSADEFTKKANELFSNKIT